MPGEMVYVDAREIEQALSGLRGRGQNMVEVHMQVAQILHNFVEDKFEDQGPGWKGLAPSTLARRRASSSPKILQDTGHLVGSFQSDAGPDHAEVFTNVPYARYHLEGDGVEKRDFFDVDLDSALSMAEEIIVDAIARGR